jgi:hypothetical protein
MSTRREWPRKLCYRAEKKWRPLPEWAMSLIDIGWAFQDSPKTEDRISTTLLLPNRGFAATFIALGNVLSQAVPSPSEADLEQHFADLLSLAEPHRPTASLVYFLEGRAMRGVFDGIYKENGASFIRVRVERDFAHRTSGTTYVIGKSRAIDLHIDREGDGTLGKHIYSRATVRNAAFVEGLYTPSEANLIHISSLPTITVFSRVNSMRAEVCEERFIRKSDAAKAGEGFLNEVLRVDRFTPASTRPRARLIATASDEIVLTQGAKDSSLVIFDGADAYLKWHHHFSQSDIVTLLSPTDSQIEDAVANVNARSMTRTLPDIEGSMSDFLKLGAGSDGTVFRERRR